MHGVVNTTSYKRRLQHSSQRVCQQPASSLADLRGPPLGGLQSNSGDRTYSRHAYVHEHAQYQNSSCYSYRKGRKVPGLTSETLRHKSIDIAHSGHGIRRYAHAQALWCMMQHVSFYLRTVLVSTNIAGTLPKHEGVWRT